MLFCSHPAAAPHKLQSDGPAVLQRSLCRWADARCTRIPAPFRLGNSSVIIESNVWHLMTKEESCDALTPMWQWGTGMFKAKGSGVQQEWPQPAQGLDVLPGKGYRHRGHSQIIFFSYMHTQQQEQLLLVERLPCFWACPFNRIHFLNGRSPKSQIPKHIIRAPVWYHNSSELRKQCKKTPVLKTTIKYVKINSDCKLNLNCIREKDFNGFCYDLIKTYMILVQLFSNVLLLN